MEINTKNKIKFFAQYFNQRIFSFGKEGINNHDDGKPFVLNYTVIGQDLETSYLNLKPISSISDENAIEACKAAYNLSFTYMATWETEVNTEIGYLTLKSKNSHHSFDIDFESGIVEQYQDEFNESGNSMDHYAVCDYLRSKGYALPFMGLSVDEMVKAGWVKLTS